SAASKPVEGAVVRINGQTTRTGADASPPLQSHWVRCRFKSPRTVTFRQMHHWRPRLPADCRFKLNCNRKKQEKTVLRFLLTEPAPAFRTRHCAWRFFSATKSKRRS